MKVKIKKLYENSVIPTYAKNGDAGLDLTAVSIEHDGWKKVFGTGLSIEIPPGYVGLVFPRSSIHNTRYRLTNSVGVIDSGYRGEIKFVFELQLDAVGSVYEIGDRIGQLIIIPYPQVEFEEVDQLSNTDRGVGGFGSTGK